MKALPTDLPAPCATLTPCPACAPTRPQPACATCEHGEPTESGKVICSGRYIAEDMTLLHAPTWFCASYEPRHDDTDEGADA